MSSPRASVIIPTKNRYSILREVLISLAQQDEPMEIIVLDDGSSDGTPDRVRAEFPDVRVESYGRSRGPSFRRNQGARMATGEFLFTIDDDCTLPHADTIRRTIESFDDERIGAVTIPFININKDKDLTLTVAPDDAQTYVTFDYYGGMVAFRRDLYLELGGYRSHYFYMGEEGDYAMRMLNSGHVVRLGDADPIDHHESPVRPSKRRNELGPRNLILFAWYNVPMPYFVPHILLSGFKSIVHIARLGHPDHAIRGWFRGWGAIFHEINQRAPVSKSCYMLSREIKASNIVPFADVEDRLISQENA